MRAHSGRRPGESGTREAILAAARRQFAELGYDRTSMRQVALEAGVDPTLVSHFHGTKQQLFLEVVELPFQPADVLPALLTGDRDDAGARLAHFAIGVFESEQGRSRVVSLVRAAASEPEAARLVRDLLTREVLTPIAEGIGSDDAAYRASLVMSQIVGLIMARYIVEVEPLASRDASVIADAIAPTLQRYLTGDLT
ncbi:TetR family transcriptional regulator [Pengzhenrongella sp.]|uniref:TetR/AcrR family transcriptional regulator n=1 Tax=Pengzhenrongella sp. TaxID=2888820 RepID=UPI0039C9DE83